MPLNDFLKGISPEEREKKQRDIEDKLSDPIKNANRLLDEATSNLFGSNFEVAIQQLNSAREIYWRERYAKGIINADSQLALLYEDIFYDLPGAIQIYQEAVDLCKEVDLKYDEITVLLELAPCYIKNGEKGKARNCYERASILANEIDDKQAQERIFIESQMVNADYIMSSDEQSHYLDKMNESGEDE